MFSLLHWVLLGRFHSSQAEGPYATSLPAPQRLCLPAPRTEHHVPAQPSPAPREPCRQMHAWDFPRSPWCPALPWIQVSPPQQPRTTCRPGDPLRRGSHAAQWRLPLESGTSRGASPEQAAARCHRGWCMVRARTSWSLHRQPGCLGSVCSSLPGHLHKHSMSTGTPPSGAAAEGEMQA